MSSITNKILLKGRVKNMTDSIPIGQDHQLLRLKVDIPRTSTAFGIHPADSDPIDIQVWDSKADFCEQHVKNGDQVMVEAELNYSTWTDKQTGETRGRMVVNACEIYPMSKSISHRDNSPPPALEKDWAFQPHAGRGKDGNNRNHRNHRSNSRNTNQQDMEDLPFCSKE